MNKIVPPCHALPSAQWCDSQGPGGFLGHTCYPNDVIPFNAATFFGEPGKWEVVNASGYSPAWIPEMNLDGSFANPKSWVGMRRKKVKTVRGVWLNVIQYGHELGGLAYATERGADSGMDAPRRLGGKAHYVEIEIEE